MLWKTTAMLGDLHNLSVRTEMPLALDNGSSDNSPVRPPTPVAWHPTPGGPHEKHPRSTRSPHELEK